MGKEAPSNYFVILVLDEETSQKVRTLKLSDKEFKVPYRNFYPHINIGHFLNAQKSEVIKAMKKVAKSINSFSLNINEVSLLTDDVVALVMNESDELNKVYTKLHSLLPYESDEWTNPKEGKYVPHISLFYNPGENLAEIAKVYQNMFTPFEGKVIALELSEYDGKAFKVSNRYELRKRRF